METLTSRCLDVTRCAAGGKESNIKYCGTKPALMKLINQIRTKIPEEDNSHHFQSIAFHVLFRIQPSHPYQTRTLGSPGIPTTWRSALAVKTVHSHQSTAWPIKWTHSQQPPTFQQLVAMEDLPRKGYSQNMQMFSMDLECFIVHPWGFTSKKATWQPQEEFTKFLFIWRKDLQRKLRTWSIKELSDGWEMMNTLNGSIHMYW